MCPLRIRTTGRAGEVDPQVFVPHDLARGRLEADQIAVGADGVPRAPGYFGPRFGSTSPIRFDHPLPEIRFDPRFGMQDGEQIVRMGSSPLRAVARTATGAVCGSAHRVVMCDRNARRNRGKACDDPSAIAWAGAADSAWPASIERSFPAKVERLFASGTTSELICKPIAAVWHDRC
jgi:hypothetical protein